MKKIILYAALFASTFAVAQKVGINTTNPKSTLHIVEFGKKSNIATAFLSAGAIISGNSNQEYEGIGQYFENLGNTAGSRVVKLDFANQGAFSFFGYGHASDTADYYNNTLFGANSDTGYFSINNYKGNSATEKLDVNGNARIRGLVDGTNADAATGFPYAVVTKNNGTLGYAPRSAGKIIKKSGTTSYAGPPINLGVSFKDYLPVLIRNRAADNQTNTPFPKDHAFAYYFNQAGANWQLDFWQGGTNPTNYTTGTGDVLVNYEVIFIPVAP